MRNYTNTAFLLMTMAFLASCIGTDYLDDPKDASIVTNVNSTSLEIGETFQIEAVYHYNMWLPRPETQLTWWSQDVNIATVDDQGLVTGQSKGQTTILISYAGEDTTRVRVNVVADLDDVAMVTLSSPSSAMDVGGMMQLAITVENIAGTPYTGEADTVWVSNNESVATVNDAGLVTGVGDGVAGMTATVDGVESEVLQLMVGTQGRVGTFQSVGSYDAEGVATMIVDSNDELILTFSNDFKTSFALGTFIYLANTTDGSAVKAQGLELAEITSNGGKIFNVTEINSSVGLNDYRYVIVLCKPASITFGYADMN